MDMKEDVDVLDAKITRLKVEYEQYFMHILKREPLNLREDVERVIRRYSGKPVTNTSLKFKYQSLVAKYNAFKPYWTRTLRAIEEGTYERRAEGGAMARVASVETGGGKAPSKSPRLPTPPTPPTKASAGKGDKDISEVYKSYIEAREKCSQPTRGLSFERIKKNIEEQRRKIEAKYGTKGTDVKVYIRDGTARLAVVPKKK